jgi:hypothetical protein
MTTETKDRREPVQHGFLPDIVGEEWSGWCDLSCDGGSIPPALTDRIALARAAQLRDFSVLYLLLQPASAAAVTPGGLGQYFSRPLPSFRL